MTTFAVFPYPPGFNLLSTKFETDDGDHVLMWTSEDHNAAVDDGWFLDFEDGAIQADSEGRFKTDDQAYNHVRGRASQQDERAIRAMIFDAQASKDAWVSRLSEAKGRPW